MATITPQMVKELRDKTGAGMADCKKALDETGGDMQTAVEALRKRGAAAAGKRADRSANEGIAIAKTSDDNKTAVIVEVNCETDFVARNEEFVEFVNTVTAKLLENNIGSVEELMALSVGNKTLNDLYNEMLAKFSEKIGVNRFERFASNGYVAAYIHPGSKLAVLVEVNADNLNEKAKAVTRDIAMQIAAMNPAYINRSTVDDAAIKKEIEIYKEQAIQEGKKSEIAERIATGRLEKFYQEQCLIEQAFVKDGNKTIADILKDLSAETGKETTVTRFRRYLLGESA